MAIHIVLNWSLILTNYVFIHCLVDSNQWEFQDPKMEVLYHMFGHISGVYPLKFSPEK